MDKPKIYLTRPLFEDARQILNKDFEVEYWANPERISRSTLLSAVREKEALVCLLTEKVNEELLQAGPKLRIVANVAVGYDNIDLAACTRHGVVATNTPGVLDETTADFAWTMLMAVARRVVEGDHIARSGEWKGWDLDQLCGADVWGKTLGILGFGRIGRAVARRSKGFKMRVLYHDAVRAPAEVEAELGAEFADFNKVLGESDFVTVHVPLLPETRQLISTPQLVRMKSTAFLINTSRGPVVDEAALVAALERGKIAGAALDVYENEPFIHPGLRRPNVVLAPHIASASLETRTKMACIAAENVVAVFEGRTPPNALNPEVLEKKQASD
ncbi:MAG TPA: D-glycerate dehydrogenase [Candidatus Acidoferrales bacterium]|nr:D-glycerate dehydrogenase [Candidatus Acidoferrales bacterium]